MATNPTLTLILDEEWTRSTAVVPAVIPPHPPLLSGGWYHGLATEAVGPGRMPLTKSAPKSVGVAFVLSVLFGPMGMCYVSANAGLTATALTATALIIASAGLAPLLAIWPLAVLGSVWGAGHLRVRG